VIVAKAFAGQLRQNETLKPLDMCPISALRAGEGEVVSVTRVPHPMLSGERNETLIEIAHDQV
jgi:hypothetical protein